MYPLLAEYVPEAPQAHCSRVLASLGKRRNGQRQALQDEAVVADAASGLVLRRPGLDERLPGLALLHDPLLARKTLGQLLGKDPGDVTVRLVAHRLGKRAVMRVDIKERTLYARVRATKSTDGVRRFVRHRTLWSALSSRSRLRIPEPLGMSPALGLSLFSALPGSLPDFSGGDSEAISVGLQDLQSLAIPELPVHGGEDEARLLNDWLQRCQRYRPQLARRLEPGIDSVVRALVAERAERRPAHRDLHEKQILMANGTAGLLDFDTLSLAPPSLDAGNLLAHLFLAEQDETPLRRAVDTPGIGLWRSAALFRLVMIHAFTSASATTLDRLIDEAMHLAVD